MKKAVLFVLCAALLLTLSTCGNRRERTREKAIAFAEDNLDLLRSYAQEWQTAAESQLSERPDSLCYMVKRQSDGSLCLYDRWTQTETEYHSEMCQQLLKKRLIKGIDLYYYNGAWSVKFFCGGAGIGSNTEYWEIECISTDEPADLCFYDDTMTWTERDNGFFGRQENGDNTFYYYRIAEGVFYTEASF